MFSITKTATAFAIAASALALPVAAQAAEPAPQTFQRDGVAYSYVSTAKKGHTVISGDANRIPFRLVVRGSRVSGEYNYRPVEFSLRDVKGVSADALALR